MSRGLRRAGIALLLAAVLLPGCGKGRIDGLAPPNQRPTVRLTQAPASPTLPYHFAYELRWTGFDPDGRVEAYEYAIDPPTHAGADTLWVSTRENRLLALFRSAEIDSARAPSTRGVHTVVVRAVDDRGARSLVETRSFNSLTVTPTARILQPAPNRLLTPTLAPSFRVSWTGTDPDGRTRSTPVQYKWKVFGEDGTEIDFVRVLVDPDTLRRRYGPSYAEWDSVTGDTTEVSLRDLVPEKRYVFVLIAVDEVGSTTTSFSYDLNMLTFYVSYAGVIGPRLSVFNESFAYQYPAAGYSLDPSTFVRSDAPADRPLRVGWSAEPQRGTFITGYRWMVDGNVGDETPRRDENTDIQYWSQWSPSTVEAVLPPVSPPPGRDIETRFFYLEARDNNDARSLAVVEFNFVRPSFERELLFVDDTRMREDQRLTNGTLDRPRGAWPTAAELDTAFFAIGGQPWQAYPAGTLSPPGVFAGYDFDTLGTRFQRDGRVTLQQLGRYRHIVWYADNRGALYNNPPYFPSQPTTTLHALAGPGVSNVLATWVTQGGKLWVFGGGIATSLQRDWEKTGTSATVFSSLDGELVPGRMMYDLMRWRSEIQVGTSSQARRPTLVPSGPGVPDYSSLPATLNAKSAATDPFATYAPNRTNSAEFYLSSYNAEVLSRANEVTEDFDPTIDGVDARSVLDTLYVTVGGSVGSERPVMTLYRGLQHPPIVMSGFALWHFRREQQLPLADFVLQRLWGLPRREVPR
jgi:hypothetical protein